MSFVYLSVCLSVSLLVEAGRLARRWAERVARALLLLAVGEVVVAEERRPSVASALAEDARALSAGAHGRGGGRQADGCQDVVPEVAGGAGATERGGRRQIHGVKRLEKA